MFNDAWYDSIGKFLKIILRRFRQKDSIMVKFLLTSYVTVSCTGPIKLGHFFVSTINEFCGFHSFYKFGASSKSAERFPFAVEQERTVL